MTFSTPLTRNTNTLGIDLSGYTFLSSFNSLSSTVSAKENALTFSKPLTRTTNTIGIDLSGYATTTALNAKENVLTFSAPLSRATNTISIDLSSYLTTATAATTYLKLNGTNEMSGILIVLNNTLKALPEWGFYGVLGGGNRIVLEKGTESTYPYSFGLDANVLWYSTPTGAPHKFYVGSTVLLQIASGTSTLTGTLNATTLQEGGTNLDAKYLRLSGTTSMTGTLTGTTINATTLQEGGTNLDAKYSRLTGATDMSGKLTVSNANGLTTPAIGDYGSTGDGIILWKGGTGYPYSFGMNEGTLWYSYPNGAVHNFYVNGKSVLTISSGGIVSTGPIAGTVINEAGQALSARYLGLGGGTLTGALNVANGLNITGADTSAQSLYMKSTDYNIGIAGIAGNYSSWAAKDDMIIRTLGTKKLILQSGSDGAICINSANNVGIGRNNPSASYELDVNGNINGNTIYEGGQSLASKYLSSATLAKIF